MLFLVKEVVYIRKVKKSESKSQLEPLTFHIARHTWATLAYSAGIDKAVINDCLCHIGSSMRVTDICITKDWEVMWKANEKVLSLFDWSNI